MSDPTDPDRNLDASIRRLVADAGADAPSAPDPLTFTATEPIVAAPSCRPIRWVTGVAVGLVAAAVIALVIVATKDDPNDVLRPADSTPPESSIPEPTTAPEVATTATMPEPTTTAPAPSTTLPAPIPITRPIGDPAICETVSARAGEVHGISFFARTLSNNPVPVQVIGDPIAGPTGRFALLQRYFGDERTVHGQELVEINGVDVWISTHTNGNGEAVWHVGDGSQGYLRSRGIGRDELVAIVGGLTPRPPDDPLPGFDYAPTSAVPLTLLHEQLNDDVTGEVAASECRVETTGYVYRISAIDGDPVFEYGGVIDRPPPLEVGIRDGVLIVLDGVADPTAPTVDDVVDVEPDTWLQLQTQPPAGWPVDDERDRPIGPGFDVVVPLVPADSTTPTSYLTLRLARHEGVPFLEVHTRDAVLAEDAAFWMTDLSPGGGGISSASPEAIGSVLGFRVSETPPGETIEATISIIDGGGFVLQSTGPIQLMPQL